MATVSIAGYTADLDYARIVHINNPKFKYVRSFKIIETQDRAVWTLTINQSVLVGQYSTQAAAIGALVGCIIHRDGDLEGAEASITDMLSRGSTIDPDVNIFTIEVTGADPDQALGGTVSAIDYSVAPTAGEFWFGYQNSTDGGSTWGVDGLESSFIVGDRVVAASGGSQIDTPSTATYDAFSENSLMRGVLVERILTATAGLATTGTYAAGALWATNSVTGLVNTEKGITALAGAVGVSLTVTFQSQALRDNFLNTAEYLELNGNTNLVLASSFTIDSTVQISSTSAEAISAVADIDSLGPGASWDVEVVGYDISNIVGTSSNTILKDDVNDLTLALEISGESTAGAPVEIGGFAYAIPTIGGVPEGQSYSLTYAWSREIPLLDDLVISGESAVAPTLTASGDQAADSLTVGDTASITASATGTPAPTISYQWKVDAVNSGTDQATFDTSGLSGGEVLTCVVTASNGVSPDDTATIDFGTVAAAAGNDYTDYMIPGTSYWIIPAATSTNLISRTGGDTSASWTQLGKGDAGGSSIVTSQTGTVVMNDTYYYYIRGGFNQKSNPYQFCATWCDGTSGFRAPQAPGWVIWEAETTPGSLNGSLQVFAPIEVQSGVVGGSTTAAGYGPQWNLTGNDDSLVFFFNSYTPGDVQGWMAWDGTTTP